MEDRPRYNKDTCFDPFPFRLRTISRSAAFASLAKTWTLTASEFSAKHYRLTLTGLYNVLERLREGIGPEALNANEKRVFDDGLVLILKELHDRLDAAVADAYGWPVDLPDEDILARLVALNNERAKDEARGLVAWLRPEYQIPRFGTAKEKAELDRIGGGEEHGSAYRRRAASSVPQRRLRPDRRRHGCSRRSVRPPRRRRDRGGLQAEPQNCAKWVSPSLPLRDVVPVWWTPLDTRSLDLITRARFRRWANASVTTRPAASTSVVCAGLGIHLPPIAERRGSHG